MSQFNGTNETSEFAATIQAFVQGSAGLLLTQSDLQGLQIQQDTDGKSIQLSVSQIEEVIDRIDNDGKNFLQVNFVDGRKILLTTKLVGFKPARCMGLDMEKLPKVVTTPDLISVVEAIEENINTEGSHPVELEVLKKVFDAVLEGGEAVGFNLSAERDWIRRLATTRHKPSA